MRPSTSLVVVRSVLRHRLPIPKGRPVKSVTQTRSSDDKWVVGPIDDNRERRAARERLPEEVVALTAERLRVIAEPNRIALLEALNEGEATVQELADRLAAPHQKVSKHLAVLYQAGMVRRRREGATVIYALVDWTGWWVVEQIGRCVRASIEGESDGGGY